MIPSYTRAISERFRDKELIIKRYINSPSLLYFYFCSPLASCARAYSVEGRSLCIKSCIQGRVYQFSSRLQSLYYKALQGLAPRYLGPLTRVADLPGRRSLRCASANRLDVPFV